MAFIVNGADWDFNGLSAEQVEQQIDRVLAFIDRSIARDEEVLIGDDFQYRPVIGGATIWDLFAEDGPVRLPGEVFQELAGWLGKARYYADSDNWPEGMDDTLVAIGSAAPNENTDLAWVHHCVRVGRPAACYTLGPSAVLATVTAKGHATVHFVGDESGRRSFWRDLIVLQGDNADSLVSYSSHAYPDLCFVAGVLGHLNRLGGGYLAVRASVQATFAALDDWGHWAFTWPPPAMAPNEGPPPDPTALPNNQLIQNRFAGVGLVAAPENPNVRTHRRSREARETALKGRTLYCEWHVKLEPHRNRIHFHGPIPESGDKVVVAMIDEHLPLPP